jgi:tripeptidyl-peptidase-1
LVATAPRIMGKYTDTAHFAMLTVCLSLYYLQGVAAELPYSYQRMGQAKFSASRYSVEPSDPTVKLEVMFAIKQNNVDWMKQRLDEISYPNSPSYGQRMTRAEIGALCGNPDATANVHNFLNGVAGVIKLESTPYGEYIKATAPISVWQTVFNAKYEYYKNSETSFHAVREYYLPSTITNDVSTVFSTIQGPLNGPGTFKPRVVSSKMSPGSMKRAADPAVQFNISVAPLMEVTPAVLNQLYDISFNNGGGYGSQAVYESVNESYSVADLTTFQNLFSLPLQQPSTDIDGHVIQGPCINGFENCGEANLDVQYLMAVSQSVPTTFWYDPSGLNSFLYTVCSTTNPPFVISISYLANEEDIDQATADAFNTEAVKLGLLGVSMIMAAGDGGASGQYVESTAANCGYNPGWPGTSMYVTTVGATQGYPETVCSSGSHAIITSGGGFSNLYPTAPFQVNQVAHYFNVATTPYQNTSAPHKFFNASGRGYPDIAAQGAFYAIVINGSETFVAGTSASTPVFAAMVALVNSERIRAGKASLGWLNPTLYTYYESFVNDVTVGNNSCMEVDDLSVPVVCCQEGFFAAPGWDPTTGLGTVNFTKFLQVMLDLPDAFPPTANPTAGPSSIPPTPNPTAHHNSKNGKYFGVACACFLGAVGVYTYIMNMQAINAMVGCGKTPLAAADGAEMTNTA